MLLALLLPPVAGSSCLYGCFSKPQAVGVSSEGAAAEFIDIFAGTIDTPRMIVIY